MDIAKTRDRLVDIIRPAVPDSVQVHRSAFDGVAVFPAVVIGMPGWEDDTSANYCFPKWSWPVAVCVARPGTSDEVTVSELDDLWPAVFGALRDAARNDQTLGGVCSQAVAERAMFGQFAIQSQGTYPAQMITLELYG